MSLLEGRSLAVTFGGVRALDAVSFRVAQGELVGLIGPNGAGKTTLLKALTGSLRPAAGSVHIDGRDVTRMPTHRRVKAGLAMTHQIVRPFADLTLLENVAVAAARDRTDRPWRALLSLDRSAAAARARALLAALHIDDAADRVAGTLPLGYLKRLEMARALATRPRVVMLDEPLAGLNQGEAVRIADEIVALNASGLTVVLVEHNLAEVVRVVNRLLVLDNGRLIADGAPGEVMDRDDVRDAYLGPGHRTGAEPAGA